MNSGNFLHFFELLIFLNKYLYKLLLPTPHPPHPLNPLLTPCEPYCHLPLGCGPHRLRTTVVYRWYNQWIDTGVNEQVYEIIGGKIYFNCNFFELKMNDNEIISDFFLLLYTQSQLFNLRFIEIAQIFF